MKVGVLVPGPVPYSFGGSERVARGLATWIGDNTPHVAEVVIPPSPEADLRDVIGSYEAWSGLDAGRFDLVVSTKYPSWMVDHPRHVVHLQHTLRGLYDTYPSGEPFRAQATVPEVDALLDVVRRPPDRAALAEVFGRFREVAASLGPDDPALRFPGPLARELVHYLDRVGLDAQAARAHFGISATVAITRGYFPPGVCAEVLVPPSGLDGLRGGRYEYLFTASRLDHPKRVDLLVEAMRHVPGETELLIAGAGPEEARLRALAAGDERIRFLGHVTDEELSGLYANALAVPFVPLQEDLGLITLEAQLSAKPVVTCRDSGGPTELVIDGLDGFVTAADPAALGAALARLVAAPELARQMGERGRQRARRITWSRVTETLLAGSERPRRTRRRADRPKIVIPSTFPVHPPLGGGQLRSHHLYRELARGPDVEIVSLAPVDHAAGRVVHEPGFVETVVPKSTSHDQRERQIEARVHMPVTDIVAAALAPLSPVFVETLHAALDDAHGVVLSHPYFFPTVAELRPDLPVVLDAYNAEFALKDAVLPDSPAGEALRAIVRRVEWEAIHASRLVATCSPDDAAALEGEYGPFPMIHIANGVDVSGTSFVTGEDRNRASRVWRLAFSRFRRHFSGVTHLALFLGSWHPPNLDAVEQIVALAPDLPDTGFIVAGSVCGGFQGRPIPRNVALLGVVSDAMKQSLLAAADVGLNPMTLGSGTNLKLVEYFAAGVPAVSTEFGARGLGVTDGREAVLTNIADFADALRGLLDDPASANAIAHRARALAADRFDWRVLGARLRQEVCAALGLATCARGE